MPLTFSIREQSMFPKFNETYLLKMRHITLNMSVIFSAGGTGADMTGL